MKIGPLGGHHTDCLKSDGSTFASRGLPHTVCLRSDGSAFACGSQDSLQVDVLQTSGARQGMLTKLLLASHSSQCCPYTRKVWNSSALPQPASPHFYPRVSQCYAVLLRLIFYFAGSRELLLRQFGGTPVFPALLS